MQPSTVLQCMNDNGVSPFISEECINSGLLPLLCVHSSHVYQLREMLSAVSVPTGEPGIHLGRPAELQNVLRSATVHLTMQIRD